MKHLRTAAVALGLVAAVTLSGCSIVGNPIGQVIEGATGGQVDLGGNSVPQDYPTDAVPLIDGEVLSGARVGSEGSRIWNIGIRVDGASTLGTIVSDLEAAGFTGVQSGDGSANSGTAALTSTNYSVVVVVTQDSTGWVANYTVTENGVLGGGGEQQ